VESFQLYLIIILHREKSVTFLKLAVLWQDIANIKCVDDVNTKKYIFLEAEVKDCFYSVGQGPVKSIVRVLNLEKLGCCSKRTITHEIWHALGFLHEHQKFDRNNYVKIKMSNIKINALPNFIIFFWITDKLEYDFESIMHYTKNSFSKNKNKNTIEPKEPFRHFTDTMGTQTELSHGDRLQAISVYGE
jgi:hypothetical protein